MIGATLSCGALVTSHKWGMIPVQAALQTAGLARAACARAGSAPQRAGPALWQSARATRVRGRRLLVQDTWYRHLAIADRLIVEARRRLADQKTHIADLEQQGEDTRTATALLSLLEETLRLMQSHRATILQKLAGLAQPEPRPAAPVDGF
jgi:hypothetical protein